VEPARLIAGLVDVLTATLDIGGSEDVLRVLENGDDTLPQLIDILWRWSTLGSPRCWGVRCTPSGQGRREGGAEGVGEAPEPLTCPVTARRAVGRSGSASAQDRVGRAPLTVEHGGGRRPVRHDPHRPQRELLGQIRDLRQPPSAHSRCVALRHE
jgi:hypothetical protein